MNLKRGRNSVIGKLLWLKMQLDVRLMKADQACVYNKLEDYNTSYTLNQLGLHAPTSTHF